MVTWKQIFALKSMIDSSNQSINNKAMTEIDLETLK